MMLGTSFFLYSIGQNSITWTYLSDAEKWGLITCPGRKGNVIFENLASCSSDEHFHSSTY